MTALARLSQGASRLLGRSLTPLELERFGAYLKMLLQWQRTQRLVGSSDPDWIVDRLILDSLVFRVALPDDCGRLMDLGAGAGLPGVPLKIVGACKDMVLVEARRRRASFLSAVIRELSLDSVAVVNDRAENLATAMEATFDGVVMRCAGPLADLLGLALRFVRPRGVVVAGGPPAPGSESGIEWLQVSGPREDQSRWLAVARRS